MQVGAGFLRKSSNQVCVQLLQDQKLHLGTMVANIPPHRTRFVYQ